MIQRAVVYVLYLTINKGEYNDGFGNMDAGNTGEYPLISVIIPTLDRPEHLREAVASVILQTYHRIELIIIDDSEQRSDDLGDFLEDHGFDNFTYIHGRNHDTAASARNTGIKVSNGEYLAFLDDDDCWKESKLERQIEIFQDNTESLGVVFTGQRYVDSEGTSLGEKNFTPKENVTKQILIGNPLNPFSCAMVRSEVVEKAGYIDERMRFWEDREWFLRISKHFAFGGVPEPLAIRRMGDYEQLSDDFEARVSSHKIFLRKHRDYAEQFGPPVKHKFVGWLSRGVALSALRDGRYFHAIWYSTKAITCNPDDVRAYMYLLAALGGNRGYCLAVYVKRKLNEWKDTGRMGV